MTRYYITWIEGLSCRKGEKILDLTSTGVSYTTLMTSALRIRECDIHRMKHYLKRHGISEWVLNSPNTFIETSYVPKGTLYKFPQI